MTVGEMMEKKRSIGVTILSWYLMITSVICAYFFLPSVFLSITYDDPRVSLKLISLIGGIMAFFVGYNIRKLKPLWRMIGIYYCIFELLYILLDIFITKDITNIFGVPSGGVIIICILFFLTRPKVKEQFK